MKAFTARLYDIYLEVDEPETTFTLRTARNGIEVKHGALAEVFAEAEKRGVKPYEFRYEEWIVDDSEIYEELVAILQEAVR